MNLKEIREEAENKIADILKDLESDGLSIAGIDLFFLGYYPDGRSKFRIIIRAQS